MLDLKLQCAGDTEPPKTRLKLCFIMLILALTFGTMRKTSRHDPYRQLR
jgi:hypothetical protein